MSKLIAWFLCIPCRRRILRYLAQRVTQWDNSLTPPHPRNATARSVSDIAFGANTSDWRARVCLRELSRKGLVEQNAPDHWQLALSTKEEGGEKTIDHL